MFLNYTIQINLSRIRTHRHIPYVLHNFINTFHDYFLTIPIQGGPLSEPPDSFFYRT